VGAHADAAVRELVESAFAPLDPGRCARLLHGERGFWVADFLDQADPPPAYGLFAHASPAALERRARRLLAGPRAALAVGREGGR
jgi:hypothetical protein